MKVLLGIIISTLAELYKSLLGRKPSVYEVNIFVILLSFIVGAFMFFLEGTQIWKYVVGVVSTAAVVYNFAIKPAKKVFKKENN